MKYEIGEELAQHATELIMKFDQKNELNLFIFLIYFFIILMLIIVYEKYIYLYVYIHYGHVEACPEKK